MFTLIANAVAATELEDYAAAVTEYDLANTEALDLDHANYEWKNTPEGRAARDASDKRFRAACTALGRWGADPRTF